MTSPAADARPHDARTTGSTTPVDGSPRRPRRRRGGRGRSSPQPPNQAASGVPAADAPGTSEEPTPAGGGSSGTRQASPGGAAPRGAAPSRRPATARWTHDEARLAARRAAVPRITYPEALPVSARRDDIAAAIRDHQVVIVAGETGSGKTTQIPKICLELGRGVTGMIGHTQPRRLAARTVADRIAEELGTELGDVVGYKVRFTDRVGENTLVKLMTDGILLAELTGDRTLRQYDTLIVDEAHERSLNIDFILGYLTQLLPRRPDLKVVITSATIDTERFARHFADALGTTVPVVEVSGRSYPVEVR
ncbi:MAG: ATP-dependent helicase HrpA, partial [Pseudonocardiales bacterium]|nr:ATP-dependent helicase HrpA [Pseudonocardiales bacterium]